MRSRAGVSRGVLSAPQCSSKRGHREARLQGPGEGRGMLSAGLQRRGAKVQQGRQGGAQEGRCDGIGGGECRDGGATREKGRAVSKATNNHSRSHFQCTRDRRGGGSESCRGGKGGRRWQETRGLTGLGPWVPLLLLALHQTAHWTAAEGAPVFHARWNIHTVILNPDCQYARKTAVASAAPRRPAGTAPHRASPSTFFARFNIHTVTLNPDCQYARRTVVVNGGAPGPTIRVREGTRVVVQVHNSQPIPVTIHWHGVTQQGSPWSDGVHGVTQCDIAPGTSYTYNFSTSGHAGTLWWHAHVAMLRNTVFGGLIVLPRAGSLGGEASGRRPVPVPITGVSTIFLMDWYYDTTKGLLSNVPGWVAPDALLMNGGNHFPGCPKTKPFKLVVKPRRWYRLQVINAALFAAFSFAIERHNIYTYEGEGGYLKPMAFPSYAILSGQSYSFLLFANQKPATYWIGGRPLYDSLGVAPALGILEYATAAPRLQRLLPSGKGFFSGPFYDEANLQLPRTVAATRPPNWIHKVDKLIVLELNYDTKGGQQLGFSVNNVSMKLPAIPPLYSAWKGDSRALHAGLVPPLPPPKLHAYTGPAKHGFGVIEVPHGAVVQLVIQSRPVIQMNPHPFHLHGYNFYVMGSARGSFNPKKWKSYKYNLKNPVFRNTMWVRQAEWTAVRFKADNPGTWLLHCHLEPHADGGMLAVLHVNKKNGIPRMPRDYPTCDGKRLT